MRKRQFYIGNVDYDQQADSVLERNSPLRRPPPAVSSSREDSSGNRFDYTYNPDGSVARLTSSVAGQATPVEIQDYVYLPATDPNTGKVARIDIRRGDTTLVRSTTFTYHDGTTAFGTLV
jgi:hypothetical protein